MGTIRSFVDSEFVKTCHDQVENDCCVHCKSAFSMQSRLKNQFACPYGQTLGLLIQALVLSASHQGSLCFPTKKNIKQQQGGTHIPIHTFLVSSTALFKATFVLKNMKRIRCVIQGLRIQQLCCLLQSDPIDILSSVSKLLTTRNQALWACFQNSRYGG